APTASARERLPWVRRKRGCSSRGLTRNIATPGALPLIPAFNETPRRQGADSAERLGQTRGVLTSWRFIPFVPEKPAASSRGAGHGARAASAFDEEHAQPVPPP